ncbi:glucosamine-6-phosphate deaminase [Natronospora cellulosivora (SeqCode)]
MRIIVEKDYQAMSKKAALLLAGQIGLKPNSVIGLATGSTPLGMYEELISMYRNGDLDFSEVTTFNLDEYYGLSADNDQSYHFYMQENFFKDVNIKADNILIPDGMANNVEKECKDYENEIKSKGGIDFQVLGIGANGHIGFNEPDERLNVATSIVDLTEETISDNSRFFESMDMVPKKAISMGMATILKARRIILLASGENKAEAIKETVNGFISTDTPSSLLQTHPDVTLVIDEAAASLIK